MLHMHEVTGSSPVVPTITGVYAHPDEREIAFAVSFSCYTWKPHAMRGDKDAEPLQRKTSNNKMQVAANREQKNQRRNQRRVN